MNHRQEFVAYAASCAQTEAPANWYVAAVGIDSFTRIRAAIGYELAEELVAALTERVRLIFPAAFAARLAPDTIGVLLTSTAAVDTVTAMLAALCNELEQSVELQGHRIHAGVRAGFSGGPSSARIDILHQAELALDQARAHGRRLQAFSLEEYGDPGSRLAMLDEMRRGLDQGEVSLVYQPQVCTRTGQVSGAEALMRWTSPTRGIVPPDHFIATAEETGQMRYLTEFAIRQALEDTERFEREGFPMRIAINISGRLLSDRAFVQHALGLLSGARQQITFEITESAVIDDWKTVLENLSLFSAAGVRLSIDDYGSGFSSLAYVQQLPIQELKIDRSFISQLTTTHRDPLLVRSTIELGHALDLEVVGEGVEDAETLALLTVMGCDLAQGYFVGRPMPLADMLAYLRSGTAQALIARPFAFSFSVS